MAKAGTIERTWASSRELLERGEGVTYNAALIVSLRTIDAEQRLLWSRILVSIGESDGRE